MRSAPLYIGKKSYERIFNHLQDILPDVDDEEIERLLK